MLERVLLHLYDLSKPFSSSPSPSSTCFFFALRIFVCFFLKNSFVLFGMLRREMGALLGLEEHEKVFKAAWFRVHPQGIFFGQM
jgi:hypothetical protein